MRYIALENRAVIEDVILDQSPTMLFVEHDRHFVERVASHVFDLGSPEYHE